MRSIFRCAAITLLLLPGCVVDLDPDGLEDTDSVSQSGTGPGGGDPEPAPAPCQGPTSPNRPIRYQALLPDQAVVFDLPAGCMKYFSITAVGFTQTEITVTQVGANENPDLYVTVIDEVPGPLSGGCHSENPPGQPEDCYASDPGHQDLKIFLKIAVRATTALTGIKLTPNQF